MVQRFFFLQYGDRLVRGGCERKTGLVSETRDTSVSRQEVVIITIFALSFLFIDLGSLEMCYCSLAWPVCASCRTHSPMYLASSK